MQPEEIADAVTQSGLRGRGGAGFATGQKWSFIPKGPDVLKYLCVNADESEPGTFSNRELLEHDPHQLIEGIILSCRALYITTGLHLHPRRVLPRRQADGAGDRASLRRRLPRQGHPRQRASTSTSSCSAAPAPTSAARRRRCWRAWRASGRCRARARPSRRWSASTPSRPSSTTSRRSATSSTSSSAASSGTPPSATRPRTPARRSTRSAGWSSAPATTRSPLGTTLRELIFEHAGGMHEGRTFKAVSPGGTSTPMFTEEQLDIAMDYDTVVANGSFLGSGRLPCDGRHRLDAARHPAHVALLPPRVVRQVHALPRGHALDRADHDAHLLRRGPAGGYRPPAEHLHRPGLVGQPANAPGDDRLPARPVRRAAGRERHPPLPPRVRVHHPARRRLPARHDRSCRPLGQGRPPRAASPVAAD